ncbi:MAG: hypothetical protein JKY97_09885, partial [Citromicrobium sp.]|nr:hypothetical protein [Citromicrobium sp.]
MKRARVTQETAFRHHERAMRSRNRLLADNRLDDSWLSGIEAQMAELGIAMALARSELVGMLAGM